MGDQDHRPLDPAAFRYSSSEENGHADVSLIESKRDKRRRRGLICCGCCVATTLVIGLTILILAFTVFKVKSPTMTFNSTKIIGLDLVNTRPGINVTFTSDISIKNPNIASFKFTNATTHLYYGDVDIGEAKSPPGNAGARKTIHMNVTIDIMVDTVTNVSRFPSDLRAGEMPIESYTGISGRVNVLNIFKKHIDIELRCTMTVEISSQTVTDKVCKRKVHM